MPPAMSGLMALAPKWADRHASTETTGGVVPTVKTKVADVLPAELAALILILDVPAVAGVPEITPVALSRVNPAGSGPALYVIGVVPPEEVIV